MDTKNCTKFLDASNYKDVLYSYIQEYGIYKITLPNSGYREFKSKSAMLKWAEGFNDGIRSLKYIQSKK
jgi:hypothetical protein